MFIACLPVLGEYCDANADSRLRMTNIDIYHVSKPGCCPLEIVFCPRKTTDTSRITSMKGMNSSSLVVDNLITPGVAHI